MKLFKTRTQEEAYNSLLAFLFPGKAIEFVNDTSDPTGALLNALAREIVRALNSMNDLSEDYDILVTTQLLSNWESALGIPDSCFPASGSDTERRLHVLLKFAKMNVQTAEQMRQLAVALGFVDTTVVPLSNNSLPPYEVPFIPSSAPDNRYIIQVTASGAVTNFPPYDVPFIPSSVNESLLACIFDIIKPANCKVIFSNAPDPTFSPNTLASNIGWYDGSDFNSMTLNASGLVSVWTNKAGGGSDLVQIPPSAALFPLGFPSVFYTIGAQRPRFVATVVNGQGIVRFDGTKSLGATSGDLLNLPTGDSTIMFVAKKNDINTASFVTSWTTGGELQQFVNYQDSAIPSDSQEVVDPDTVEGQFEVILAKKEGSTLTIQVGDTTEVTNSEGSAGAVADAFQVGALDSNFGFDGDIGEIAIFDEALSTTNINLMKTYFNNKWGV